MSYLARTHPTGCVIVDGDGIPMPALLELVGTNKVADPHLSHQLNACAVIGTRPQLAALRQALELEPEPGHDS